mmetsp:Transcript_27106/g.81807  ORF Transcript_27106/g.81807 Transcript_27106/m.81807 type:complete len:147 (-) Transcript_27106:705-1145(-)
MQSVSDQLAEGLDARLGERVDEIRDDGAGVVLKVDGKALAFDRVVVATEGPAAARLLPGRAAPASRASTCLYFRRADLLKAGSRRRRDCDVVDIFAEISRAAAAVVTRIFCGARASGTSRSTRRICRRAIPLSSSTQAAGRPPTRR